MSLYCQIVIMANFCVATKVNQLSEELKEGQARVAEVSLHLCYQQ